MADETRFNPGDPLAADEISGVMHLRTKLQTGVDGVAADVSESDPIPSRTEPLDQRFKAYEDTSFVSGDSPVTLDFNADTGRLGRAGTVTCDGAGDILVSVSNDGITFSDTYRLQAQETFELIDVVVDSIKITHVTDSAYRVQVI